MPSSPRRRAPRGFTLVEAMVVLAILGVLASLAGGALDRLGAAAVVQAQAAEFTAALRFARSEALKRGENVSVCARDAGQARACAASPAQGWQAGWLVFVDRGERGRVEASDIVLRVHDPLDRSGGAPATLRLVTYGATGISVNAAGHVQFRPPGAGIGHDDDARAALVCIAKPGRARLAPTGSVTCST